MAHSHECLGCGFTVYACNTVNCPALRTTWMCFMCQDDHPWTENIRLYTKTLNEEIELQHSSRPLAAGAINCGICQNMEIQIREYKAAKESKTDYAMST